MSMVERYAQNLAGRDYVVGDIHGCFDQLQRALDAADFDGTQDRIFSVGDLIDRGPDSAAALDWLYKPWFHPVLGNHEEMMLQALDRGDLHAGTLWVLNGGDWHRRVPADRLEALLVQVAGLPLAMEIDTGEYRIGIVHADIPPGYTWAQLLAALEGADSDEHSRLREYLLWSRARHLGRGVGRVDGIEAVYTGHTIVPAPASHSNVHFIDTGAFLPGGHLTLLQL
jgi:serine/threonine protein phosphatase 1